MKPPSTSWREEVSPNESELFHRYGEKIAEIQKKKSEKYGTGRTLHRKQVLALQALFQVRDNLPNHARHGLFSQPKEYQAQIRLSNGSMDRESDRKPDIRGFAIKVLGVSGPSALGSGLTQSQVFSLINHEVFTSAKSEEFLSFLVAAGNGPGAILKHLLSAYGVLGAVGQIRKLAKTVGKPFSGFATETFFSAVPIACGPYAVRIRLMPEISDLKMSSKQDWATQMKGYLSERPLKFDFQLQFFVDESITPVENASKNWPEDEAPYLSVAKLIIPQQDFASETYKNLGEKVESALFDPWNALMEHRPLGEIMRARRVMYFFSGKARGAI